MVVLTSNKTLAWHHNTRTWRTRLTEWVFLLLDLGLRFFAIRPLWPSLALAQPICIGCWFIEIATVTFYAFYNRYSGSGNSIGSIVSTVLFTAKVLAHFMMLLEMSLHTYRRENIFELADRIACTLRVQCQRSRQENLASWQLALQLLLILILQVGLLVLFLFIKVESIYWYAMLSVLAIKFRILEILSLIVTINASIRALSRNIDEISSQNFKSFTDLPTISEYKLHDNELRLFDDEKQLITLKNVHNDLNSIFRDLNYCYGWSLLAITAVYFVDFVCNSYWLLLAVLIQIRDFSAFIQNGCFVLIDAVMLSLICWHSQQSCNNGRDIGSSIFKLVKPLGNQSYNHLVSEFSLQILHQQFIITAKDFFQLNLNLLGSMVAAIVTYLVILLQFMLSEQNQI